ADDTVLAADAVVLATGMAAAPFAAQVPGERDRLGRVLVDAALKAPAALDIFVAGEAGARGLLGMATVPYTQQRYVTCLDLGRSGAVITDGWERHVQKTGSEGKAVKRLINTQIIYPPAEGTAEALLAHSSIDLAARACPIDARPIDGTKEKAA